jgi:hypothetical protein
MDDHCLVGMATAAASAPGWTDQANVNHTGRTADGLYPMLLTKEKSLGMLEHRGGNHLTTVARLG